MKTDDWINRLSDSGGHERYISLLRENAAFLGDGAVSLFSAPGRTELSGNHTDHQAGRVLCAAVTDDIAAAAVMTGDDTVTLHSEGFGEIAVALDRLDARADETGTSAGIVRGVAAGLQKRGYAIGGFRAVLDSRVPVGGGLSSSAAFEVLTGAIFSELYNGGSVDALTLARVGQAAERDYFGKPCGLMDQTASAVGGVMMIDFRDEENPVVTPLDFDFRDFGYVLCAVDTGTNHNDLTADYAAIPADMGAVAAFFGKNVLREVPPEEFERAVSDGKTLPLSPLALSRAEHFFEENERVGHMAAALARGDIQNYVNLMNASGASSRYKLRNVTPPSRPGEDGMARALDRAQELLFGRGAARVHGGGFAGRIQCLVPEEDFERFRIGMDALCGEGACVRLQLRSRGAGKENFDV